MKTIIHANGMRVYFTATGLYAAPSYLFIILDNATVEDHRQFLSRYFGEEQNVLHLHNSDFDGSRCVANGAENIRYVLDTLHQNGIIGYLDRTRAEEPLQYAERCEYLNSKLSFKTSIAQKEMLIYFIEPFVEDLLPRDDFSKALRYIEVIQWSAVAHDYDKDPLGMMYKDNGSADYQTVIRLMDEEGKLDSAKVLCKAYAGQANLEETFLALGDYLPKKDTQEKLINNFLFQKLTEIYDIQDKSFHFLLYVSMINHELHRLNKYFGDEDYSEEKFKLYFQSYEFCYIGNNDLFKLIAASVLNLGVSFVDTGLQDHITPKQQYVLRKFLVGDESEYLCGSISPRFSYSSYSYKEQADWRSVATDASDDHFGPGYGF